MAMATTMHNAIVRIVPGRPALHLCAPVPLSIALEPLHVGVRMTTARQWQQRGFQGGQLMDTRRS